MTRGRTWFNTLRQRDRGERVRLIGDKRSRVRALIEDLHGELSSESSSIWEISLSKFSKSYSEPVPWTNDVELASLASYSSMRVSHFAYLPGELHWHRKSTDAASSPYYKRKIKFGFYTPSNEILPPSFTAHANPALSSNVATPKPFPAQPIP